MTSGIEADDANSVTAAEAGADKFADGRALFADPRGRFAERKRQPAKAQARFLAIVLAVLFAHIAIIAAFLIRDANTRIQTAALQETPVEVIVEKPPEPPQPKPKPKPPEPPKPKPKEEIEKPALSAPRAPNEEKVETERTQPKTIIPKAPQPPSEGQPQPKVAIAPPKQAAPDESKEDTAKKQDDTKPDAEALDKAKARARTARKTRSRQAKAAPKRRQRTTDVLASLAGSSPLDQMSFAKPTAKSPVYGGTEDVRYLAIVEGMLVHKLTRLPRTAHWQDGGHVVIFFHLDESGRVISRDFYEKSGYPEIDQLAMRALLAAQPFPPPPRGLERGLLWGSKFDGQLPSYTMTKR